MRTSSQVLAVLGLWNHPPRNGWKIFWDFKLSKKDLLDCLNPSHRTPLTAENTTVSSKQPTQKNTQTNKNIAENHDSSRQKTRATIF